VRRRIDSLFIAGVVTLALVACSKGDAPKADSTAAAPRALVGAPPPAAMPGALTKPINAYTADEFSDFVAQLKYTSANTRQRNCKGSPGCGAGGSKKTDVMIEAIVTQDSLGAANVPKFGVIYAHAANLGAEQEARYGFLPGPRYQYYILITGDSAKGMSWHLEQLDTSAGARKLAEIGNGVFRGCGHQWTRGARADFKTCAQSASGRDSVVRLGLLLQGGDDAPFWVGCGEGCCVGDGS
jgi:hypothetical protein